jgi:hypothetical protein
MIEEQRSMSKQTSNTNNSKLKINSKQKTAPRIFFLPRREQKHVTYI